MLKLQMVLLGSHKLALVAQQQQLARLVYHCVPASNEDGIYFLTYKRKDNEKNMVINNWMHYGIWI